MKIKSASGVTLPQLPEGAYCEISGVSPAKMRKCPLMSFDDMGGYCVPELCESYKIAERRRKHEGADHAKPGR